MIGKLKNFNSYDILIIKLFPADEKSSLKQSEFVKVDIFRYFRIFLLEQTLLQISSNGISCKSGTSADIDIITLSLPSICKSASLSLLEKIALYIECPSDFN